MDTFKYAFKKTIPVMCGYIFLGIGFGLLVQNSGRGVIWSFLMSFFIYAGSMQYLLISLLESNVSIATIAIMTLLINSRHIFYGISFIEKFKNMGKKYFYMIFSLTDETYSVLCTVMPSTNHEEKKLMFYIAVMDHFYWILGSVLGSFLGSKISFNLSGIDFAMTALFIIIFIEQILSSKTKLPAVVGVVSSVVCLLILGPSKFILPSLIFTVAVLLLIRHKIEEKGEAK